MTNIDRVSNPPTRAYGFDDKPDKVLAVEAVSQYCEKYTPRGEDGSWWVDVDPDFAGRELFVYRKNGNITIVPIPARVGAVVDCTVTENVND